MALRSNALTTTDKVKLQLGISGSTQDSILEALINQVSTAIESYCARKFKSQSYTEIKDTRNQKKVFLNQFPVSVISSVKYRSGTPSTPIWLDWDSNSYMTYLAEGYISFFSPLPPLEQGIQIVYTAGYLIDFTNESNETLHTLPEDLTQACNDLVANYYTLRQSQGIESMTTEGQTVVFSKDTKTMPTHIAAILDTYKTLHYAI